MRFRSARPPYHRRLVLGLVGSLLFHTVFFLLPWPSPRSPAVKAGRGDDADAGGGRFGRAALHGLAIALHTPPPAPVRPSPPSRPLRRVAPRPAPAEVTVRTPPLEPEAAAPAPSSTPATPVAPRTPQLAPQTSPSTDTAPRGTPQASGVDALPGPAGPPGEPGDGGALRELALRPRVWVHPQLPQRILRKRKIDDFVLLQNRVGIDGRVREVRVLRAIPNCDECNAAAVEAARRFEYNPAMIDGRLAEVWTTPFDVRFTWRR